MLKTFEIYQNYLKLVYQLGNIPMKPNKAVKCVSDNSKRLYQTQAPGNTSRCVTFENLNPFIKRIDFPVRGPLVIRASEIEEEIKRGVRKPFTEVIKANIGDSHATGQKPITFIRQVLAMVSYPMLLNNKCFPEDVKMKARLILENCQGKSVGSYSDGPGIKYIRKHVARYIEQRDGIPCNWENVILTAGASDGIRGIIKMLDSAVSKKRPGVMIPIPQFPLYSATLTEYNFHQINYYLNEDNEWSLDIPELERAYDKAYEYCNPKGIVVINPGNPTGQVLSKDNIAEICKFAYDRKLLIMADEVYQENIYKPTSRFHSFKKVLTQLGEPYNTMELASFMSCSKGYMGECGLRGGYVEVINMCPLVKSMYLKMISCVNLCSSVLGQAVIDCFTNPPQTGEPSYGLYMLEKMAILESLLIRAKMVEDAFNSSPGLCCNPIQGAMYAFPKIELSPKAMAAAKKRNIPADAYYAFELLEKTGICVVPGSGFGQKEGTYHFRTTILPQIDKLKDMLEKFNKFQKNFMSDYN